MIHIRTISIWIINNKHLYSILYIIIQIIIISDKENNNLYDCDELKNYEKIYESIN